MTRRRRSSDSWTLQKDIGFDVQLPTGRWYVEGHLRIDMIRDRNADACADGRGHDVTYEDDRVWTITKAEPYSERGMGAPLTGADIPADVLAGAEQEAATYDLSYVERDIHDEEPPDFDDWRERQRERASCHD